MLRAFFTILAFCAFSSSALTCDNTPKGWKNLNFINSPEANLHSFLTYSARKPQSLEAFMSDSSISDKDKQTLKNSVVQYQTFTKQKRFHPLFDRGELALLTEWFGKNEPLIGVNVNPVSQSYFATVGLYKEHFWQAHCQQNSIWQANLQSKLTQYGEEINQRLGQLFLGELVNVPRHRIFAHARPFTRQGAFTSGREYVTHMNTFQPSFRDWYALELLFHELSHIPFSENERLKNGIEQTFEKHGIAEHAGIWHPILFYTVGEVTRQAIIAEHPDYLPYANKKSLYKGRWDYFPELEQHWLPYINGQVSFEQALDNLAKAVKLNASFK
ncbi:hypothetical protein HG263_07625 [Pseudoalteromonas sp. JBTF-M23]|uniref:DUF2268 domain-containing protein n=1 Tax=Pseudoalteromonas caenipelagi TaxID=2726988 RepID=A0A849VC88_9GAMM|nr:hypothetical protein [Pseudoalteromonas caenipelagi]NOU50410.1 hypothetical protein [Pseudoalteromonas caenipelagi]